MQGRRRENDYPDLGGNPFIFWPKDIAQMFHLILDQFISHEIMAHYTYPLLLTISLMHFAIHNLQHML